MGSSQGVGVNLATGELEITPDSDISVYNPNGPQVVFGRIYNHLHSSLDPLYNIGDFGEGWSHNYNMGIADNNVTFAPVFPAGATSTLQNTLSEDHLRNSSLAFS